MEEYLNASVHELSGGQRQRVALGGVLVEQVDILLFDEPLANLDPATGKHAISLIHEIQERLNCTVVIIEHRLEDVLAEQVDRRSEERRVGKESRSQMTEHVRT